MIISQYEEEELRYERIYHRTRNECGLCWYGPCMCEGVVHWTAKDTAIVVQTPKGLRTKLVCVPMPPDEHLA